MKPGELGTHLEAYQALEKALGLSLRARERLLRDFVTFIEARELKGPIRALLSGYKSHNLSCLRSPES